MNIQYIINSKTIQDLQDNSGRKKKSRSTSEFQTGTSKFVLIIVNIAWLQIFSLRHYVSIEEVGVVKFSQQCMYLCVNVQYYNQNQSYVLSKSDVSPIHITCAQNAKENLNITCASYPADWQYRFLVKHFDSNLGNWLSIGP